MCTKNEELKDEEFRVCGCNKTLEVSKNGVVRMRDNGQILEKRLDDKGKYFIVDDPSGERPFEYVHRLVALTYLRKPLGKFMEVHHIDSEKLNNNSDNLVWELKCLHEMIHDRSLLCGECNEECEYRE